MSYCTTADLVNLTGSTLASSVLQEIIDQADRQIKAALDDAGIGAPSSDDKLKTASLYLSCSILMTRMRLDGSKPSSFRLGDFAISDNIDEAGKQLAAESASLVLAYIRTHGQYDRYRWLIRKVT